MKERTFFIHNFGCRASQSEGASIVEELSTRSVPEADSAFSADVVIVNSCTVTEEADRELRQMVRRIASRNPTAQIIVTGCYAQRAPEELADLPRVRYVVGNSHKHLVGSLAHELIDTEDPSSGRAEIYCSSIFLEKELKPASHVGSGGRTRAVVKIQDGCDANCSFCIIPTVRGRSRSIDPDAVLNEVQDLVSREYKEIVFSGIHLGVYGRDLPHRTNLRSLLLRVLETTSLQRVRLSSVEPVEVTPEIIDLVATQRRMARHFHIPLQSGSSRILRAMRRPYTPAYYSALLSSIRMRIPDAAIGADIMVGFPGESDDEFSETYHLIENSPMTYGHVFPYSVRPGTVAAGLPNQTPDHVSRFRAKALRQLVSAKNESFRRALIGSDLEALVLENGTAISSNFLKVSIPPAYPENEWIQVRVTGVTPDGLQAS